MSYAGALVHCYCIIGQNLSVMLMYGIRKNDNNDVKHLN